MHIPLAEIIDFEKEIRITGTDVGEAYRIRVYNSGKPINGTDIQNVWQSFYRADKAHSRKEGRFGLGLSIVKSIMTNHKCRYGVKNTDDGVVFTFEVSKDSEYYDEKQ